MKRTLIIGATSAIAEATARLFADSGDSLFLVGRDSQKISAIANDLKIRGASAVHTARLDVLDFDQHAPILDAAVAALDGLDLALIAHGTLPDQKACEQSFALTRKEFETNTLTTVSLLTHLANYFEDKGRGIIVVIGSVAGDRGRQSNYVYGSAKGAISIFLQGLRNRLHKRGVRVVTVKPGFVDTPMTETFEKNSLWADRQTVARCINKAVTNRKDVVYAPAFWRIIMTIVRLIPERLFKRLSL